MKNFLINRLYCVVKKQIDKAISFLTSITQFEIINFLERLNLLYRFGNEWSCERAFVYFRFSVLADCFSRNKNNNNQYEMINGHFILFDRSLSLSLSWSIVSKSELCCRISMAKIWLNFVLSLAVEEILVTYGLEGFLENLKKI